MIRGRGMPAHTPATKEAGQNIRGLWLLDGFRKVVEPQRSVDGQSMIFQRLKIHRSRGL